MTNLPSPVADKTYFRVNREATSVDEISGSALLGSAFPGRLYWFSDGHAGKLHPEVADSREGAIEKCRAFVMIDLGNNRERIQKMAAAQQAFAEKLLKTITL